ncbi:MAG: hypothetical protein A2928_04710 [Candidatus Taylorbacteria bacterium RIFCSPLOWO2_01_FULL_45_15b]|uniref:MGS-like domain-containing protein n=1 Tax=Candidatus Taylorbacteria bacterium RIFCSPLOWO2_01_FULL_45_15b TaxID=1802319 RepID=A0A1G2NDR6_9BACT|nr:MAG: hypothetical protein A2928_04710 [Candidatus Taylorbacteria bacterium RIFCSPLOWO2_01_FULL_45_15b]
MQRKRTALLSAYNKDGLDEFADTLKKRNWDLLASAGTKKFLGQQGIEARDVADLVGVPILGHRVVTLSREIHAALLAQDTPEDNAELERLGIPRIDLVYVDLYPLVEEIAKTERTILSVIEKTDIGGPTLLRSAAKGRRIVVSSPLQFKWVLENMDRTDYHDYDTRFISKLVAEAEETVSRYCRASASFHAKIAGVELRAH